VFFQQSQITLKPNNANMKTLLLTFVFLLSAVAMIAPSDSAKFENIKIRADTVKGKASHIWCLK
jgi:hypothetical protein